MDDKLRFKEAIVLVTPVLGVNPFDAKTQTLCSLPAIPPECGLESQLHGFLAGPRSEPFAFLCLSLLEC